MLLALATIDYGVLALYLAAMVAIGFYFSREQQTSRDFFLAGRAMGWFPIGVSIMATLLSALSYSGIPGEAYFVGYKLLLPPLMVWCCWPLLAAVFLPLYYRLQLFSIYEYLELRYDGATRILSSLLFVLWRLLWLGGVLYAPCKVLVVAAGLDIPTEWLLLILGLVSTFYTFLGGMKAVIWTDVIQAVVMALGLILIVGSVWWQMDGGATRVAAVTRGLGRSQAIDTTFDLSAKWSIWGAIPHFLLASLSFYVADQITVQRYLTAESLRSARRSFVLNCLSVSLMVPALMYAGLAIMAFYHDHPQSMRPIWVANVDPQSHESLRDDRDRALIGWKHEAITTENIDELVGQQRLLRPNLKRPFKDTRDLILEQDGRPSVNVDRLATRRPPAEGMKKGEVILNNRAKDELLPHYITSQLPLGVAGLILAALLAASMSSIDSGLNSICTLAITDFHRRLGWGRSWLARRLNKPESELSEADELRIGRPLVLLIGVAATLFSLVIAQINDIFTIMISVVNTFGGPLLAVFLLGVFTRRTTARAAFWTLIAGTLFTVWLMASNTYPSAYWLWPWQQHLNGIWPLTFGVVFSLVWGYSTSFVLGTRSTAAELRGLVVGCGPLGGRGPEEASYAIPDSFDQD